MAATARKRDYPAKKAKGTRKTARAQVHSVAVSERAGTWTAHGSKKSACSTTSAASAARKLAQLLGYPPSADVRYVAPLPGGQAFEIVEVQP